MLVLGIQFKQFGCRINFYAKKCLSQKIKESKKLRCQKCQVSKKIVEIFEMVVLIEMVEMVAGFLEFCFQG